MRRNQHVVPHIGASAVRGEHTQRLTVTADTQAEAIQIAREIAINQQSEL